MAARTRFWCELRPGGWVDAEIKVRGRFYLAPPDWNRVAAGQILDNVSKYIIARLAQAEARHR